MNPSEPPSPLQADNKNKKMPQKRINQQKKGHLKKKLAFFLFD